MQSRTLSWHRLLQAVQLTQPSQKTQRIFDFWGQGQPLPPTSTWWSSNHMWTPPRCTPRSGMWLNFHPCPFISGNLQRLYVLPDDEVGNLASGPSVPAGKVTELCLRERLLSFSRGFSWESMFSLGWGFPGVRDLSLQYVTDLKWECNHLLLFKSSVLQVFYKIWI